MLISMTISLTAPLITSKIIYNDVRPGGKHIVVMLLITYIFFNVLMGLGLGLLTPI